jgi:peptide/nickel transport system substrate-binding protein
MDKPENAISRRSVLAATGGIALSGFLRAVPAAAQTPGKKLVVGLSIIPDAIDPMLSTVPPSSRPLYENYTECLVGPDADGNIVPWLADFTFLEGGKIIEYRLKPNVKFHSGDPLTTDDIVFTHERSMAKIPQYKRNAVGLNRIEKIDSLTVRLIYDQPNISLHSSGYMRIGSKAYFDRVGEQEYTRKPVGTGPYRLTEYQLGQYYDLEAFDGYWGGPSAIKSARLVVVRDDATRVAMLRSGEADFLYSVPYNMVAALEKEGFHIEKCLSHPTVALNFQTFNRKAPWADRRVRQAIAHAIDGDAIVKGLVNGIPSRFAILSPGEIGYDPDLKPYAYDPKKAKQLLSEAGYANGFTMPMAYVVTYPGMRETANATVLYLKAVGINVEAKLIENTEAQATMTEKSKDPNFLWTFLRGTSLSNNGDTAVAISLIFASNSATSLYKIENPEFDELSKKALATLDDKERGDLIRKALRIAYEEVGVLVLWQAVNIYAMKSAYSFKPIQHNTPLLHVRDITTKS